MARADYVHAMCCQFMFKFVVCFGGVRFNQDIRIFSSNQFDVYANYYKMLRKAIRLKCVPNSLRMNALTNRNYDVHKKWKMPYFNYFPNKLRNENSLMEKKVSLKFKIRLERIARMTISMLQLLTRLDYYYVLQCSNFFSFVSFI